MYFKSLCDHIAGLFPHRQTRRIHKSRLRTPRAIERLEERIVLTPGTFTWDGGAGVMDPNWTSAANWVGDVAPTAGADLNFPSGAPGFINNNDFADGTIFGAVSFGGGYTINGNSFGVGGLEISGDSMTMLGADIFLDGNIVVDVSGTSTLYMTGGFTDGVSTYGVTKNGTGMMMLSGEGSFDGDLILNGGITMATVAGALGTGTTTVAHSASLELTGAQSISSDFVLEGMPAPDSQKLVVGAGSQLSGDLSLTPGNNQSISTNSGVVEFTGELSGSNDLDKNGNGTFVFDGTSVFTGKLNVYGGTVLVNSTLNSPLFLEATLGGTGTVGNVEVSGIGVLAPGNHLEATTTGILSTGDLTMGPGAIYSVELNGAMMGSGYDSVSVTGLVTLANGTLSVDLAAGPPIGTTFTIVSNDGLDAISGTFNGLAEGATFTSGAYTLAVSYVGGDGNDVVLTVTDATFVWTGAGTDRDWSNGNNWLGGMAPSPGSNLVFPNTGVATRESANDFSQGTPFKSITIEGSGYDIYGASIALAEGITATYTGSSSVDLAIDRTASSSTVTVNNGATLNLTGVNSGSSELVKTGAGVLRLSGSNTYTGNTTVSAGELVVANSSGLGDVVGSTSVSAGALISYDNVGLAAAETLSLDANSTLRSSGVTSLLGAVVLQGPNIGIQSGTGGTLTVSGVVGGSIIGGALTFGAVGTYTGVVHLSAANTFYHTVDVSAGTLLLSNNAALGDVIAGVGTVASGATIRLESSVTVSEGIASIQGTGGDGLGALQSGVGVNTWNGPIGLAGNTTIGVDSGAALVASGVISDASGAGWTLTKASGGSLSLNGANTFSGDLDVEDGDLVVGNVAALGGAGATILAAGTTVNFIALQLDPIPEAFVINGPVTMTSGLLGADLSGPIQLNAELTLDAMTGLTLSGVISSTGDYGLNKSGLGSLTLSGANTYAGTTNVTAGTLIVLDPLGLGDASSGTSVLDGATLSFGIVAGSTVEEPLTLGSNTLSSTTVMTLSGGATDLAGDITLGSNLTISTTGAHTISGVISDPLNGYSIAVMGSLLEPSSLQLTAENQTSGNYTVSYGNLIAGSSGAFGAQTATVSTSIMGTVGFAGVDLFIPQTINVNGLGSSSSPSALHAISGNVDLTGVINLDPTARIGASDGATLKVSGELVNMDNMLLTLNSEVSGRVELSGDNSQFNGTFMVMSGYLRFSGDMSPAGNDAGLAYINMFSGSTLELDGSVSIQETKQVFLYGTGVGLQSKVVVVSGSHTIEGPIVLSSTFSVVVPVESTLTVNGEISESGTQGVYKEGVGTLVLGGVNTYTGSTGVIEGTLIVNGTVTEGSLYVQGDATLGGTGSVGDVLFHTGSTLAPGASPGLLTVTDNLNLDSGTTFSVELDGTERGTEYDSLDVSGIVTLNDAVLSATLNFDLPPGSTSFTIINNTSVLPVIGTFADLPEGGTFTLNGHTFTVSYSGGDGNDVVLTGVNAPTVDTVTPVRGPGTGGTEFTITGSNFLSGATVTVNGVPATDVVVVSPTVITAVTPAGVSGTFDVVVTNAAGGDGTLAAAFTYYTAPTAITLLPGFVDENLESGAVVGLLSSVDADPGATHTYELISGLGGDDNDKFEIIDNEVRTTAVLDFETQSAYSIRVLVTDDDGLTFEQILFINATDVNETPTDIELSVSTFPENAAIGTVIGAFNAIDPDMSDCHSFTLINGEGGDDNDRFTIDDDGNLVTDSTFDYETQSSFSIRVLVTDKGSLTFEKVITVAVTPVNDNEPEVTSPLTYEVDENTTAVGVVTASDADLPGDTISFSISGGADQSLFTIDPVTGALSFITAPDYESPADSDLDNVYEVIVLASDGLFATPATVNVTVLPVNDNAPMLVTSPIYIMTENQLDAGTPVTTDADLPAQTIATTITGGADAALFTVNPSTGMLSFLVAPDFENPLDANADNNYEVELTFSDLEGQTTTVLFTVQVTGYDDVAPVFTSPTSFDIDENETAIGTVNATDADVPPSEGLVFSIVGGDDSELFTINPLTGELSFVAAPDYENPQGSIDGNGYQVIVEVSDSFQTTQQTITVNVQPVNEVAPQFTSLADWMVDENVTVVGTIAATDADQPADGQVFSITGGVDAALFAIDPVTGVLSFLSAPDFEVPLDQGADNVYNVQVTVMDNGELSTSQDLTITVNNVTEVPTIVLNEETAVYHAGKDRAFVDPTAQFVADSTQNEYANAVLTVSISQNRQRKDKLNILGKGDDAGEINVKGKKVLFGGVEVGRLSGGRKGDLIVTFNGLANQDVVQALVKRINFTTKNTRAPQPVRTVTMQIVNVNGQIGNVATREISVVE